MPTAKIGRRFTYGDQFEQGKTPLLELLISARDNEPDLAALEEQIRVNYFPGHGSAHNSKTMAMNCRLSMNAYGLIKVDGKARTYEVTDLGRELLELGQRDAAGMFRRFALHILTELPGLTLLRLIETIRARGERVSLEYLGEELNDIGLRISPSSTYISTMVSWLARANVMLERGYEVNWDVVYDLLNVDADLIDKMYVLLPEQKFFMLSMMALGVEEWTSSATVAEHTRSVYSIRLTTKNLVKDILEPLEAAGLIETQKTTGGRGAKPHGVRLTEKSKNELLSPMLDNLAELTELTTAALNRKFEDVVAELTHADKYKRGIALELFSVWIVRLLGLRFTKWRAKNFKETGGGEVDVMAASDRVVYSRWQIQCKNTKSKVDVDIIAKEVGLTFITKADVVMFVTTGSFTSNAVDYANQVTEVSRYYVILLDGNDIQRIVEDRARIIEILNIKARRVFAKRELGLTEFGDAEQLSAEETELEEAIAAQAGDKIAEDIASDE
jgi:site-specific DNA-methyltransferase (cytosine-N4-specific)